MTKFDITGMSCAACSARVEKAVSKLSGVSKCNVNLLTNSMMVDSTLKPEEIIKAVEDAGYGATLHGGKPKEKQSNSILKRLIASVVFLLALMYISMGHSMLNLPVPSLLSDNNIAMGISQMLLTIIVMIINQKFFISGFTALVRKSPNMDTLVALGSGAAFVCSVCVLFLLTEAERLGNIEEASRLMSQFYFESSAMILTLITVGKSLEERSKGKTTNALKALINLSPKTATVIRDDKEIIISADDVSVGDVFIVKPGESIPVDGIVISGSGSVDESFITGESIPVDKQECSKVIGASINQFGHLTCKATKVGENTTLSQIIKTVSDATATKAPISKIADKVAGIFVPTVMLIALITTVIWIFISNDFGYSLARGISVLVISCPCALGLATPVAIMVGSGVGAKHGILYKTAESLEQSGKINIVALDKTGTITSGKPSVTDIISDDKNYLLKIAYSVERLSEHPLAKAITKYSENNNVTKLQADHFKAISGSGLSAVIDGKTIYAGNEKYIGEYAVINSELKVKAKELSNQGKTPIFFAENDKLIGIIAVADTIKDDSKDAINNLKKQGCKIYMLTGDNKTTANAIGKSVNIENIISDVMPSQKEEAISKLLKGGNVCMVGDGINDAPALTRADLGIAIGSGTDIAIDAADIVIMKNSLEDVATALQLGKATVKNIRENLFWAFIYNIIGIPIAAGALVPFGITLSPMLGALAMSLSSFCVVSNALRLNMFKPNSERKIKMENKITIKIEGMMCPHCEGHMKDELSKIDGVTVLEISHSQNMAVVSASREISADEFKSAVTNAGYEFKGIA